MRSVYSSQGTFIDIGANTGQYSLIISRYAKEVHAFEPWEPVLKRFRRMVERNGIKNIIIHGYGLGSDNSKKRFFKPAETNLGTGSFAEGFKSENPRQVNWKSESATMFSRTSGSHRFQ
jgi:FkbM family methyltransferase